MSSVPSHHVLLFCGPICNDCVLAILRCSFRLIHSSQGLPEPSLTPDLIGLP